MKNPLSYVLIALAHFLSHAFTGDQLDAAIDLVRQAADKFADNRNRRAFVLAALTNQLHLPDAAAAILLEMAVQAVKQGEDKLLQKLDDVLTPPAAVPPPAVPSLLPAPTPDPDEPTGLAEGHDFTTVERGDDPAGEALAEAQAPLPAQDPDEPVI